MTVFPLCFVFFSFKTQIASHMQNFFFTHDFQGVGACGAYTDLPFPCLVVRVEFYSL